MSSTFLTLLHQEHSIQVKQTIGDGRCFFRAVARSLPNDTQKSETVLADSLRHKVCDYLAANESDFTDFMDNSEKKKFKSDIVKMRQSSTFADNFAIMALAKELKKDIIILQPTDPLKISTHEVVRIIHDAVKGPDDQGAIVVHYNGLDRMAGYSGGGHYSAVEYSRDIKFKTEDKLKVVTSTMLKKQTLQYTNFFNKASNNTVSEGEAIVLSPDVVSKLERVGSNFNAACDVRVLNAPYLRTGVQAAKNDIHSRIVDLTTKPAIAQSDLQKLSDGLATMVVKHANSGVLELIKALVKEIFKVLCFNKLKDDSTTKSVNVFH